MGGFVLLLLLVLPWGSGGEGVCRHCPGPVRNDSMVAQFCASRSGTESEGRCCRERGARPERLLGLDLSNCSLQSLPLDLAEATTAIVLDLTENPLGPLPDGSFEGFTHLQSLAVPLALECPGGSSAWEQVTTRGSSRLCQDQRNPCNSSGDLGKVFGEGGPGAEGSPQPGPMNPPPVLCQPGPALRMPLAPRMAPASSSASAKAPSTATSACVRETSPCCSSVGSSEVPPYPCPSCCGAPSAGKPRPSERGGEGVAPLLRPGAGRGALCLRGLRVPGSG